MTNDSMTENKNRLPGKGKAVVVWINFYLLHIQLRRHAIPSIITHNFYQVITLR